MTKQKNRIQIIKVGLWRSLSTLPLSVRGKTQLLSESAKSTNECTDFSELDREENSDILKGFLRNIVRLENSNILKGFLKNVVILKEKKLQNENLK